MNLKIIKTDDGSDTLYNKKLDETYHSLHGSVTESKHVYINAGLSSVIDENSKGPISILEVGLGTGLNLLLTLKFAKKNDLKIQYHAIEPFPLDNSILKKLDFNNKLEGFDKKIYEKIHHPKNLEPVKLSEHISFTKSITRLEQISFEKEKYDLVFFDAFAPSKQPDIWSKENFKLIKDAMKTSGVLVTYSSSGKLKKILEDLKFNIEILQGPKGKKEMTRATK